MDDKVREDIYAGLKSYYAAITELARRTTELRPGGYTYSYVLNVLKGNRNNDRILELAACLLLEKRAEEAARRHRIQEGVNAAKQYQVAI